MTISSMTGFASVSGAVGEYSWIIEIKTVNSKGLDVKIRLPPFLEQMEARLRHSLSKAISRGACQIQCQVVRQAGETSVSINEALLKSLMNGFSDIAHRLGASPISFSELIGVKGVLEFNEAKPDAESLETLETAIYSDFQQAIEALIQSRKAEGAELHAILAGKLDGIEALTMAAVHAPGRQPEAVAERLSLNIEALFGVNAQLDPQRLHQEAVIIATRADIREELDRLGAHVGSARATLAVDGPVGRRLDFLCQEFGREANTLCAKSADIALTAIGLDLKTLIEQFREQIQNVE